MKSYAQDYYREETRFSMQNFGTFYGGFSIAPSLLKNKPFRVYSFGIGEDLSFSQALVDTYGEDVEIYGFDPTPKAVSYVEHNLSSLKNRFHFFPYGISHSDGTCDFYLPQNPDFVSGSVIHHINTSDESVLLTFKTFSTICSELGHQKIDVIKMNIEGSEFDVIPALLRSGIEFTQLCVEMHDRFFKDGEQRLNALMADLKNHGYQIIYIDKDKGESVLTFAKTDLAMPSI